MKIWWGIHHLWLVAGLLPQEVDQLLEEAEEAEVMLLQGEHIIRLIWTTPHTILPCHLHAG